MTFQLNFRLSKTEEWTMETNGIINENSYIYQVKYMIGIKKKLNNFTNVSNIILEYNNQILNDIKTLKDYNIKSKHNLITYIEKN